MTNVHFPILVYHSIDDFRTSISISPSVFEKQMNWFHSHGWKTVPLSGALEAIVQGLPIPERSFAITFDDAMVSIRDLAQPVLVRFGFHATTFVITHQAGQKPAWYRLPGPYRDVPLLSFEEIHRLQDLGWEIQPHTHDHPVLSHLPYEVQLEQVRTSKSIIHDEFGVEASILAYPFGQFNEDTVRAMQDAGLRGGVTLRFSSRQDPNKPFALNRIGSAWMKDSSLRQRLAMAGLFEHYVHLKGRIKGDRSRHFQHPSNETTCGLLKK